MGTAGMEAGNPVYSRKAAGVGCPTPSLDGDRADRQSPGALPLPRVTMSNPASEPPAPQLTSQPYARLNSAGARDSERRRHEAPGISPRRTRSSEATDQWPEAALPADPRRTGPRPKAAVEAESAVTRRSTLAARSAEQEPGFSGAARPESLLKPFASLSAQRPAERTSVARGRTGRTPLPKTTRPPASSTVAPPSWNDSSSVAPLGTSRGRVHRAICAQHQLAKNPQGQCMRCERERAGQHGGGQNRSWIAPMAAMALAVLVGIALAALV